MTPAAKWFWWLIVLFAVVWYGVFRVGQVVEHQPFTGSFHGNDFRHMYLGAYMLVHDMDPYDADALRELAALRGFGNVNPYVYLPFTGLVLSPLTWMDPPEALLAWLALTHLFVVAGMVLSLLGLGLNWRDPRSIAVCTALAAFCFPLHRTLTAGQLNGALFFLYALTFFLYARGVAVWAGVVAGFAMLFKLAPGILLGFFLWEAFRSKMRGESIRKPAFAVLGMLGAVAVGLVLSVVAVGGQVHAAFWPVLRAMGYGASTWADLGQAFYRDPANQSFNSVFHHVFAPWSDMRVWVPLGAAWADALTLLAVGVLAVLTVWRTWPRPGRQDAPGLAARYGVFVLLGLLIPSIYWDHYAIIAWWPLLAAWRILGRSLRGFAVPLFLMLVLPLGALFELSTALLVCCFAVALVLGLWMLVKPGGWRGGLWSVGAALMLVRWPFSAGWFREGAGLAAMSPVLWGSLIVLALLLVGGCHGEKSETEGKS